MLPLLEAGTYGQVFTVQPGKSHLTSGTYSGVSVVWCHSAGSLTWEVQGFDAETRSYEDGDMFGFPNKSEIIINSGTWSYM